MVILIKDMYGHSLSIYTGIIHFIYRYTLLFDLEIFLYENMYFCPQFYLIVSMLGQLLHTF